MSIDKYLNKYARKHINDDAGDYEWWWNGDGVLAAAIASAARHVRKDGRHFLDDVERAELKTLERYMKAYSEDAFPETSVFEDTWLRAEAMWLFARWFSRLWD